MQNKAFQVKGLQKPRKNLHLQSGVDFGAEQGSILPCAAPTVRQDNDCQNTQTQISWKSGESW
jgi:hypothetical protein